MYGCSFRYRHSSKTHPNSQKIHQEHQRKILHDQRFCRIPRRYASPRSLISHTRRKHWSGKPSMRCTRCISYVASGLLWLLGIMSLLPLVIWWYNSPLLPNQIGYSNRPKSPSIWSSTYSLWLRIHWRCWYLVSRGTGGRVYKREWEGIGRGPLLICSLSALGMTTPGYSVFLWFKHHLFKSSQNPIHLSFFSFSFMVFF